MTQTVAGNVSRSFASRLRSFSANILLLFVSVSICLALLELATRKLFPFFNPAAQIPFQMMANGVVLGPPGKTLRQATPKGDFDLPVRFNAEGFRDSKSLADAKERDWYALGDSFTIGWGVEEQQRYSNLLEEYFKTNGISSRVFNIAIPDNIIGYGRLLNYAESRGAKIHHLIIGICMENDLRDYNDGKSSWDSMRQPVSSRPNKRAVQDWLKLRSALYVAASYTLQKSSLTRGLLEKMGISRNIDELSPKNEWNETVLKSSRDELLKVVSGRDALVLIIPARRLWHGDNMETEKRVHEAFVRMLREAGLSVLDLKPMLEEGGEPLRHYFKTDPHWNSSGHAVAARELFKTIAARVEK